MSAPPRVLPGGSPAHAARRNLRIAFWAAVSALLLATHWPKLQVGPADSPFDKLAHATGFGSLMALGSLALPSRPRWWLAAMLALLGAVDELTQGIPGIGRTADLDDWVADVAGIVVAWSFAAVTAPRDGRGIASLLGRRRTVAGLMLLAKPVNWMHLATAALAGALVGAPVAVFLDSQFVRKGPQPWQYGFVGAVLGAAVAVHALWEAGLRWRLRSAAASRPCLACGSAMAEGASACGACGVARGAVDWAPMAMMPGRTELRACLPPITIAFAALVVSSVGIIAALAFLRVRFESVEAFDHWYRTRPADVRILADLSLVALLGAWAMGRCRRRIAAIVDGGGARCLACGFDLRGTDPAAAAGTCHECGEPFVRIAPAAP